MSDRLLQDDRIFELKLGLLSLFALSYSTHGQFNWLNGCAHATEK